MRYLGKKGNSATTNKKEVKISTSNSKELLLEYLSELGQIDGAIVIELDLLEEVVGLLGPISHTQPWVQAKQEILSLVKRYGAIQVNKTEQFSDKVAFMCCHWR